MPDVLPDIIALLPEPVRGDLIVLVVLTGVLAALYPVMRSVARDERVPLPLVGRCAYWAVIVGFTVAIMLQAGIILARRLLG